MPYLSINFANPVECYDNFMNKCAGKYCHVELSITIDVPVLRVLINFAQNDAFNPQMCQTLLNNLKQKKGEMNIAFYILFGDVVSMRILNDMEEDTFLRPAKHPIYSMLKIPVEEEKLHEVITWNVKHLGRKYDIPRALLLLTPWSLPLENPPEEFFCSQIIMYMIKENNLVPVEDDLDIDHMKPDDVYRWLFTKLSSIKEEENSENGK